MKMPSYNIFYTDDDSDDHELFAEVIQLIGNDHRLYKQYNGSELMKALNLEEPKPDLVFLDLNMPVKNGFQVLQEMKADDIFKKIPVIVFSTSNDEAIINSCKKLGASLYLPKPYSYTDMRNTLQAVLSIDWKHFTASPEKFLITTN